MCPEASWAPSGAPSGIFRVCQILASLQGAQHPPPLATLSQPLTRCRPGWGSGTGGDPTVLPEGAFVIVPVVEAECEKSSATTYFWYREALDISNSISESGGLNWKMTLCLLVAWSIVGMAVVKGIQSSGKVSRERSPTHTGSCRRAWQAGG